MKGVSLILNARGVNSVVAKHATKDVVKHFAFIVATDYNCITFAATVTIMHLIESALFVRKFFKLKIIYLPCLSTMHTWGVFSFMLQSC